MPASTAPSGGEQVAFPAWFAAFLADRAIRKPSPHTAKAYRQDFTAIAAFIAGGPDGIAALSPTDLTKDAIRAAFAVYAESHEAASTGGAGRRGTRCAPSCTPASSSRRIRCR